MRIRDRPGRVARACQDFLRLNVGATYDMALRGKRTSERICLARLAWKKPFGRTENAKPHVVWHSGNPFLLFQEADVRR